MKIYAGAIYALLVAVSAEAQDQLPLKQIQSIALPNVEGSLIIWQWT